MANIFVSQGRLIYHASDFASGYVNLNGECECYFLGYPFEYMAVSLAFCVDCWVESVRDCPPPKEGENA